MCDGDSLLGNVLKHAKKREDGEKKAKHEN